jgi:hypothetical protein
VDKAWHCKYSKGHYKRNKQHYLEKDRRRKAIIREKIRALKTGRPCSDCGIPYPFYVMHFDHARGKKAFGIASGYGKSFKNVLAEIEKVRSSLL